MKKSNVRLIAAILVVLHLALFFGMVFRSKAPSAPENASPKPPAAIQTETEPETLPEVVIPDLQLPEPAETILPVEVVETIPNKPAPRPSEPARTSRETIAGTSTRSGFLRNDRPDRRTNTVYPELIGTPYYGAIVVDARTGRILHEDRATAYGYPASVTKLMTMLIVLEQAEAGVIRLDDKVAITPESVGVGGSQVYLDVRETNVFTVDELLQALMIHSANDAASALALHVAGNRETFVDMMNQRARELGMNSTRYHTSHGLPPGGGAQPDISTPYDIAILSLAALKHADTLRYTGTKLAYLPLSPIRTEKFMLANRNALVGKDPYPGCDGLKTGYHSKGGWSLTATATRGDQRVIAVVLGSPDKATRNTSIRKLLDRGFDALEK